MELSDDLSRVECPEPVEQRQKYDVELLNGEQEGRTVWTTLTPEQRVCDAQRNGHSEDEPAGPSITSLVDAS